MSIDSLIEFFHNNFDIDSRWYDFFFAHVKETYFQPTVSLIAPLIEYFDSNLFGPHIADCLLHLRTGRTHRRSSSHGSRL